MKGVQLRRECKTIMAFAPLLRSCGRPLNLDVRSHMSQVSIRDALSEALRYWEPRRIVYNCALLVVVAAVYLTNLPRARADLTFNSVQGLFVLAVLANVAYCAAYVVDVPAQLSAFRALWLRLRWVMLTVGIAFACVLANLFSHGFFGHAI